MKVKIVPEEENSLGFILSGEFHAADAGDLRRLVEEMMEKTGYEHLIIDLSQVTFLESASLSVLNSACRKAVKQNKRLSLRDPSAKVVSLLQITGLNQVFHTIFSPKRRQIS